jgi:hypothetical protein
MFRAIPADGRNQRSPEHRRPQEHQDSGTVSRLVGPPTDRLASRLAGWPTDWLADWLAGRPTGWLTELAGWLGRQPTDWLASQFPRILTW